MAHGAQHAAAALEHRVELGPLRIAIAHRAVLEWPGKGHLVPHSKSHDWLYSSEILLKGHIKPNRTPSVYRQPAYRPSQGLKSRVRKMTLTSDRIL